MKFYDFHIQGKNDSLDEILISETKRLNFNGICIFYNYNDYFKSKNNLKEVSLKLNINKVDSNKKKFNISRGLKIISKNPEELRKTIQKNYKKADILMVMGGDLKINRAVCENPKIDILSRPYYKRKDSGLNHVLAKEAAKNNITIELCLKDIIKTRGHVRAKTITQFKDIISLSNKFKFNIIITTGAKTIYDLRTPLDMLSLIKSLGITQEEAEKTISLIPELIIKHSQERDNIIVQGVKKLN